MKKLTDKQIQELLEKGPLPAETENTDAETYRRLFSSLAQEPAYTLPANFSANVTGRISAAKGARLTFKFYVLATLITVLIFAAICGILAVADKAYAAVLLSVLHYKWVLLFGLIVFISATYFDPRARNTPAAEMV